MGGGWPAACLVLAVLSVRGEERWSRPATPERRQGDWVPLSCANCHPLGDQGVQASNSLPSVLTPPPRVEEARLLPPPPPDPLFQQAATGFLQAYTQHQPLSRKPPHQFLHETTSQSIDRPQAQFLKSSNAPANSKPPQAFLQEPSADFQPPQQPQQINNQQSNRQSHLLQFNQQPFIPDNSPYLNQPLFIGPQILTASPFFPQTGIPPQNIQPINPIHVQPQIPITPNTLPIKQNFQIPAERPSFVQQITAGIQEPTSVPQQAVTQTSAPQLHYSVNDTNSQRGDGEKEEIQLLYVPVEALNQRARNLGKSKSLPSNHQNIAEQQILGATSNRFTSPGQNVDFPARKPHLEDQENFNTQSQTTKHHYNNKQNTQYQHQLPPEDQDRFNTQTHSVRQQFNVKPQNDQFQQQSYLENGQNFKHEGQNAKQRYNFKTNNQYQIQSEQDQVNLNSQFNNQQNDQFVQQHVPQDPNIHQETHNIRQHNIKLNGQSQEQTLQGQASFNSQAFNVNQQLNTHQNINNFQHQQPPVEQENFNTRGQTNQQQLFNDHPNPQFQQHLQGNQQQAFITVTDQPYIDQPLKFDHQISTEQKQPQQQFSTQQTQPQQHFDISEGHQHTVSPVTQTRVPDTITTHQIPRQKYRNPPPGVTRQVQQQFDLSEDHQQTVAPVTQTRVPDTITTQQIPRQKYRNPPPGVTRQVQHQFDLSDSHQENIAPVTQTRVPDTIPTQQIPRQKYRNPQPDITRQVPQISNNQFTRQFPQDYQQTSVTTSNLSPAQNVDAVPQVHNVRQNQQSSWSNQKQPNQYQFNQENFNQQQFQQFQQNANINQHVSQEGTRFQSEHDQVSSVAPPSSTLSPLQTTPTPNQPPLSVYMETTEDTKVNDVLRLLKNAKTIQVLDTVGPESPQVFVGPSNLKAPSGYIKFELPYLNSLESNRVERKVDKLPFFVAPLNFNPPPGYSKIPFPAPHIGSVVVSNVTVLKTALHEKPYEIEPVTISSTERYLDQYTLPAEIPSISPQLPSLINSLRDEVYTDSSTTAFPSTTTETTTAYTTPTYRGRGPNRGSHRGTSNYPTSASPTRRQQSRTRRPYDGRPYSRRQPVTTTTTTEVPSTEAPVQIYTSQPEQVAYNSNEFIQNTAAPVHLQAESNQPNLHASNPSSYYDEQFNANQFNHDQSVSQQQQATLPIENQNIPVAVNNAQRLEHYHQNSEVVGNTGEPISRSTAAPTVSVQDVQREEHTFKSQRTNDFRRDPSRQHQRFRGRQRLTTTTTESNLDSVEPQGNQFNQQTNNRGNYQNTPSRHHLRNNQHRLVENTHFEAAPQNQHAVQTERADVFQTTERLLNPQNDQFNQQNINEEQFNPHIKSGNQFQQTEPTVQHAAFQQQLQQPQAQFAQLDTSSDQSNYNVTHSQDGFNYVPASQPNPDTQFRVNQFEQINPGRDFSQQQLSSQEPHLNIQQGNLDQTRPVNPTTIQTQQNYFDQLTQQRQEERQPIVQEQVPSQNQQEFSNEQVFQLPQDNSRDPPNFSHGLQGQHISTPNQFEQVTEVAAAVSQETPVPSSVEPQVEEEPRVQQFNQRLKYNRPLSRAPVDSSISEDQSVNTRRGQYQYQSNVDNSDVSTTESAVTRASLVRVRGRVRSRQRGSTRNYHSTTTEPPNYPTTYLSRQRNTQEKEENQEYNPRKRINYSPRPTFSSLRNSNYNKAVNLEQSVTEPNYPSTEKQATLDAIQDYAEVSSTTTTTEEPSTKPARRYQHILNRNKLRRTRPTNAPSSLGSTKFLEPSTLPPVTRLPSSRARIRKPGVTTTTTTTTEYPQVNPSWNERDNFAPSAGSNEILEPLYQTRDKPQASFGFQRAPIIQKQKPVPPSSNDEEFWNQAVTIQQSTSFDFKPDASAVAVTPPSFQGSTGQIQGTFSPIWDGQIELQDGNYYDVYNQKQVGKNVNDQTPFSSDQQKVVYKDIKSRWPIGKENQYTEKTYEVKRPLVSDEEESDTSDRVYPVYREIIKPAESILEETSQVIVDPYGVEGKNLHEKDSNEPSEQNSKTIPSEEFINSEAESQPKVGALKRKITATNPGKKGGRRRGSWVRVRVRKPQDMFETAESQNLASLSENAIQAVTKTLSDKGAWSTESSTESQTTTETSSEPAETINFEEALKDMLKEFITNPEEDKDEAETEASTEVSTMNEQTNVSDSSEESKESESAESATEETHENKDKQIVDVTTLGEEVDELKTVREDIKQEDKVRTVLPEATTEIFTQGPTVIFQTIENVETTTEPEVTTTPNEQVYKHSRVLGTSTTTEISLETEICYRGRCVKTKKVDGDSDLLTTE